MFHSARLITVACFVAGCVGDSTPTGTDAGVDASSSKDSPSDSPEGGATPFCLTAAAQGAAFCADFETVTSAVDGWDSSRSSGTLKLDHTVGAQGSSTSVLMSIPDSSGQQPQYFDLALVKAVPAGATHNQVTLSFDAAFNIQTSSHLATDDVTFFDLTPKLATAQVQFGLERRYTTSTVWQFNTSSGVSAYTPTVDVSAGWHHFDILYANKMLNISEDGNVIVGGWGQGTTAPSTVDSLSFEIALTQQNDNPAIDMHYDNVLVRFQ